MQGIARGVVVQLVQQTQMPESVIERRGRVNWREAAWGYFFILPGILGVLIFTFAPVFTALGISFTNWSILARPEWVGIDNYVRMATDPVFAKVMRNTFYYTIVSVPLNLVVSLFFAIILNQKIRGLAFFRTAYFLPVISASVAVSMVWMWLLDSNFGLINLGLVRIGLSPVPWLSSPVTAMPAIIIVSVWRSMGWNMIIFLAALQDVPEDLYAAGKIDGAGNWQLFRNITFPLITPAIFFTTITGFIGSFQGFDLVYNMTQGGPARATSVVGYYIWETAFKYSKMGYGSAMAYVLFGIILVITLVQWRVRRRWVFGEE